MKTSRGLSLVECIISLFMLACGVVVMVNLYDASMRHSLSVEKRNQVTQMAEEVLDSVREWASDSNNFISTWAPYTSASLTDPRYPGVTASVRAQPGGFDLLSPFADDPQARRIPNSVVPVRVEASWEGRPDTRVLLFTYIGEPPRPGLEVGGTPPALAVQLTTGVDPLPVNGTMDFEARLTDSNGEVIPGLVFSWSVEPDPASSGNALVERLTYEGDRARLTHHFPGPAGFTSVSGAIKVKARVRYSGKDFEGESAVIQLQ